MCCWWNGFAGTDRSTPTGIVTFKDGVTTLQSAQLGSNRQASIATVLAELAMIKQLYGGKLELHASYFDKVMGTSSVREALQRDEPVAEIVAGFNPGLEEFARLRAPFLLYH